MRTINVALGLLIVCFQCVWLLWRRVQPDLQRITREVGIVFGALCLVNLVRIVFILTGLPSDNDFFRSNIFEKLVMISYQMLLILLAYSLTLMVNQRLLIETQTQEEKFSKLFRLAPYAITLTRLADGQILAVNDGFMNLTGYSHAELIGKTAFDLHIWAKEEDRAAFVDELSKNNRVQEREFQFRTKSDNILTCLLSAEIITLNGQEYVLSSSNDITKRKRAEKTLRKSEYRFRLLAETIEEVFWMADIETLKTIYVSPGYERVWGLSVQSLFDDPKSFIESIHPEDRERVFSDLEVKWTGQPFEHEYRILQPDGSIRWILDHGFPIQSETGQVTCYAGVARDITKRKQAEEALQVSLAKYQVLFDSFPLGITVSDKAGNILETNQMAEEILGVRKEDHEQRTLDDPNWMILRPDGTPMPAEEYAAIRALKENGLIADIEMGIVKPRGEITWLSVTASPVPLAKYGVVVTYLDITKRKQAEEAFRNSDVRYRALIRTSMDGFWVVDMEGRILEVGDTYCAITGYSREALLSMHISDLEDTESPEQVRAHIQVIITQGWDRFERRHRRADGSVIDVQISTIFISSQSMITGFINDITERKLLERSQNELLVERQAILDNVPVGIAYLVDGRFVWCNAKAAAQFGYSLEEVIGNTSELHFLSKEDYEEFSREAYHVLMTGEAFHKEILVKHKNNTLIWCLIYGKAIDPENPLGGSIWITDDISKRKSDEVKLRQAREDWEMTFDAIPDLIAILDSEQRVVRSNRAMTELLGLSDHATKNIKCYQCFHHTEEPPEFCPYIPMAMDGQAHAEEVFIDHLGKHFLVTTAPLWNDAGKLRGCVHVAHDITKRKLAEQELVKSQTMAEAANRAKSDFLANMSHDIRTPLNGIVGMTELALRTELSPKQKEYLEIVKISADILASLINDILDFSKIEAGRLDIDDIQFNLRDNLGNVVKTLAIKAHEKGLELAYRIHPDVPDRLQGDPARIRQIVLNLIGNAIKFTDAGEVVLEVESSVQTDDAVALHFCVRDTGIGISDDKIDKIFEPFIQSDNFITREYGGTGLGLTICSKLVSLMGGRIWVDSEVGKGSTFCFDIRLGIPKGEDVETIPTDFEKLRGLKVLVVDDNATNRRILNEMLQGWDVKPTMAENGFAALAALRQAKKDNEPFPLVIIDLYMPKIDGFELTQIIKDNPDHRGIKIILLTSAARRGDGNLCKELGISAYLSKPVRHSDLLDAIMTVVSAPISDYDQEAPLTHHPLKESQTKFNILLVDDSLINQR
ncbi:MAG: PAS domain S-box protein, partial [Deltaproteobacteria bacterium]|nr:PAS domain S-box protein [Deltaproteobacteria bacterium]